jgi:aryl-alcohol dehydrogenase
VRIKVLVVEEKDGPFLEQEVELGEPGPRQALVRIVTTGVCHTDAITRGGDLPMPFRPCSGTRVPGWWRRSVRVTQVGPATG